MNTLKRYWYIPILMITAGCAGTMVGDKLQSMLEWAGFADPDGVTPDGAAVSAWVSAFTGFSLVRVYDLLFTNRGWDNVGNMIDVKSGWLGTLKSVGAWLTGWHSPKEVQEERFDVSL